MKFWASVFFLLAGTTGAFTLFVSPTGSAAPPYDTWATAATDIQMAVNASLDGDTILVTNGTYAVTSEIQVPYGVTIRSMNGPTATVVNAGSTTNRCFKLQHTNAVVDGFLITGGRVSGATEHGGGAYCESGLLRNCQVVGNQSVDGYGGGVFVEFAARVTDCHIISNAAPNATFGYAGGIYCLLGTVERCTIRYNVACAYGGGAFCEGGLVRDCVIMNNSVTGSAGYGGGAYNLSQITVTARLENCTFAGNAAPHGGGLALSGAEAVNCISFFNSSPNEIDIAQPYANGIVINTCSPDAPAGFGNITNNPQFVNFSISDVHLRANSPCINAGTNTPGGATARDIDGQPRIFDYVADMGADETAIAACQISGNATTVWDTVFGAVCQLQYTTDLVAPAWQDAGGAQTSNLPRITLVDPSPADAYRAYRLVWLR